MASLSLIDAASRMTMADKPKRKNWIKKGAEKAAEKAKPADKKAKRNLYPNSKY